MIIWRREYPSASCVAAVATIVLSPFPNFMTDAPESQPPETKSKPAFILKCSSPHPTPDPHGSIWLQPYERFPAFGGLGLPDMTLTPLPKPRVPRVVYVGVFAPLYVCTPTQILRVVGSNTHLPRIQVPGVRAHPPSVQTFVHLTNRHYGAFSLAGRTTFFCAVHC
jgi:hypothetical protein